MELGRDKEAVECFDKVLELDPGNEIAFASRAELLEKNG